MSRQILLISVLSLFLELLLIRWIGTEIRIFAYLQNTILVVCFMGLGMGCWTCRRPASMRQVLVPLMLLVGLVGFPPVRRISDMLSVLHDLLIWFPEDVQSRGGRIASVGMGLALSVFLVVLLWAIFVPLGRMLGRLLEDHPRTLWAYSINVVGSLVGIWLFVLLSGLYQPPLVWLALFGAMAVFYTWSVEHKWGAELTLVMAVVLLAWWESHDPTVVETVWSPYQKLTIQVDKANDRYVLNVNNVNYQGILDLGDERVRAEPELFPPARRGLSQYDLPMLMHPTAKRVLVVGAGTGNDVAGALRNGAEKVVAVEIDPAIIALGRKYHPEKPYDSPKVQVVNDDARSFFANTKEKFDLVCFGLLDSHTTVAMTNVRLDNFVYTRDSLEQVRTLLAPGGIVWVSFEIQKTFVGDRIATSLQEVFGLVPLSFRYLSTGGYGYGGVVFVTGDRTTLENSLLENSRLRKLIDEFRLKSPIDITGTTRVATDDWPYLYLETAAIPLLYYLLGGLLLVIFFTFAWLLKLPRPFQRWNRGEWHFFFLGAAFLLLEMQNISKAAVVLGNTWQVNAVIITGILLVILAANGIVVRFPRWPLVPIYGCLCGSCVLLYFVDLAEFGALPYATRALVVGAFTSLPMLFSGMVFARSFQQATHKDVALGANLFGALIGGLLQSVTFVVGIRALLLIVAGLYLAAFFVDTRSRPEPASVK